MVSGSRTGGVLHDERAQERYFNKCKPVYDIREVLKLKGTKVVCNGVNVG